MNLSFSYMIQIMNQQVMPGDILKSIETHIKSLLSYSYF